MTDVTVLRTHQVPAPQLAAVRRLLDAAFGDDPEEAFSDDDWDHALGGRHVLVTDDDGTVLAHAALVARTLHVGVADAATSFATGYVEGVATEAGHEGRGYGSLAVARVGELLRAEFEFGALGTGRWSFYERLGWERWQGQTFVVESDGSRRRTEEDDDGVMVLRFGPSATVDLTGPIACEARPGDDW